MGGGVTPPHTHTLAGSHLSLFLAAAVGRPPGCAAPWPCRTEHPADAAPWQLDSVNTRLWHLCTATCCSFLGYLGPAPPRLDTCSFVPAALGWRRLARARGSRPEQGRALALLPPPATPVTARPAPRGCPSALLPGRPHAPDPARTRAGDTWVRAAQAHGPLPTRSQAVWLGPLQPSGEHLSSPFLGLPWPWAAGWVRLLLPASPLASPRRTPALPGLSTTPPHVATPRPRSAAGETEAEREEECHLRTHSE
ncbi:hypothetical protein G0U57_012481 [Chelydra serpentina]|uniref:Uncharacterized protein n=1 Tax=Chelydra serpentina TaxID=8475 RepID=A0A8T1RWC0_CHESE|nr:hypothetical protein G0U57_012481 [Chelydra serpentina]